MSRHHIRIPYAAWRRLRAQVLIRDNHRCRACGRPGRLEVDHIRPLDAGGAPTDPLNLQVLCRTCHIEKTRKENERPNPQRDEWRAFVAEMLDSGRFGQ